MRIVYFLIGLSIPFIVFLLYETTNAKWTQETRYKLERMVEIGFIEKDAKHIIKTCKTLDNPARCVSFAGAIAKHETNVCKLRNDNNCWGIKPNGEFASYRSIKHAFDDWFIRYSKYWYKHQFSLEYIEKSYYSATQQQEWIHNVQYYKNYILTGEYETQ